MTLTNAYIAIRDIQTGQSDDPDGASYHRGAGGPVVPGTWEVTKQGGTGWWMIKHPSDAILAAYKVNEIAGRGLFAVFGPQSILETIASGNDEVMPALEAWRRRAETQAQKIVRHWRTWVCDIDGEVAVTKTLINEGEILPATLPTVGTPWVLSEGSVSQLYRPALHITLAGHGLHVQLEDEPDRNP